MKVKYFLCFLITASALFAQSSPPKREFRGVWIATVLQLDWPKTSGTEAQKAALAEILDKTKESGINAVIFQIRPAGDALYASDIEPWSHWLTGQQGLAPAPFYDPLEFAIEEARKRGMEIHAWFNPFRVKRGEYPLASNHILNRHPEWALGYGTGAAAKQDIGHLIDDPVLQSKLTSSDIIQLDPGKAAVREYTLQVFMDVVNRYDIDALHIDDYFYPYPPHAVTLAQDAQTFAEENRGFGNNRADWRRDNINLLVSAIYDSIQAVKPWVKFGISPFGIWKDGVPVGISGLDAYATIYADALAWLDAQKLDYLVPQLYWPFGGGQDYGKLMPWWAEQTAKAERHFYVGQGMYRVPIWRANELPNQLYLNRENPDCQGSVFFRAQDFFTNSRGIVDSLQNNFYRYPALVPVMPWKDTIPPGIPGNLRFTSPQPGQPAQLIWDKPVIIPGGSDAARYAVYRFLTPDVTEEDRNDAKNILEIWGKASFMPPAPPNSETVYYYAVTAVDRNQNESGLSAVIAINAPESPVPAFPWDKQQDIPDTLTLFWHAVENASVYSLQISSDSTFTGLPDIYETDLSDTSFVISGLSGQSVYAWRVRASNAGGVSPWSQTYTFRTGFPSNASLIYPAHNTGDIELEPVFAWLPAQAAESYRLQIARSLDFGSSHIVADTSGLTDTTFTGVILEDNRFHFWRVMAVNEFGSSGWSEIHRFKTLDLTHVSEEARLPAEYALHANYPNPFNNMTTIPFDIAAAGHVKIIIYDAVGRQAAVQVNRRMDAGRHETVFDASGLSSGVYLIRFTAGERVLSRKMILMK